MFDDEIHHIPISQPFFCLPEPHPGCQKPKCWEHQMYSREAWLFVAQEQGFHRKRLQFAIDFMAQKEGSLIYRTS
jgi:hypothetical protein